MRQHICRTLSNSLRGDQHHVRIQREIVNQESSQRLVTLYIEDLNRLRQNGDPDICEEDRENRKMLRLSMEPKKKFRKRQVRLRAGAVNNFGVL